MKRTIAITTVLLAGCVFHASAQTTILEQWTYDEATAGLGLHEVANTGTVGTSWNYGDPTKWATDGSGYLDLAPETGTDFKTSQTFTALTGTDTYSMEIKLGAWDIPAGAPDSSVKWRLRSSASGGGVVEIQTVMSSVDGLSFTLVSAGTNYRNHNVGGVTGSEATARIDFNLADGTATYFVNGEEKESFTGQSFGTMEQFGFNKEGDWSTAGKVLKIDEQSLSVTSPPPPPVFVALEQWTYDDDADLSLHQCANTGSVGTAWQWEDTAKFATDGNGNLDVKQGTGGYKTSDAFATALSGSDTYSFEVKVAEWEIWDTPQAKLRFRMNPSGTQIGIQMVLDPVEGFGFTLVSATTNYRTYWVGGMSGTNAVARIDFNIDEGWATYFVDDDEKETFTGLTFEPMTQFLMQKSGFDTADPDTILKIDEQSLRVASTSTTLGPLTIELQSGDAILTWPGAGVLQSDDDLQGVWTDVDAGAATSPHTVNGPLAGKEFFRLRQ